MTQTIPVKGTFLNPDKFFVEELRFKIKANYGFCPRISDIRKDGSPEDHRCPCKVYRETSKCGCKLYIQPRKPKERPVIKYEKKTITIMPSHELSDLKLNDLINRQAYVNTEVKNDKGWVVGAWCNLIGGAYQGETEWFIPVQSMQLPIAEEIRQTTKSW